MKQKLFGVFTILVMLAALVGFYSPAQAAAYPTSFTTSITYQNVGTGDATIVLDFYAQGSGTPISINLPLLAANAGTSIYVGSITEVSSGFKGSAVMSSDQPLVATLVQVPPSSSIVKNRPLSNGFEAGASFVLVPTVLKNTFGNTSTVSIQNVDTVAADLTVEFVPVGGTAFSVTVDALPSGSAKYYDMGTFSHASIGSSFNGSMKITAVKDGTSTPGAVVATVLEQGVTNNWAFAWEGITSVASTLYMPSALCSYYSGMNSYYAVQNTTTSPINVTVTYSNGNFETINNLAGGSKYSFKGCGDTGTLNPALFSGAATITATGNIAAMAKIQGSNVNTAFPGFTGGARYIALPYVRWTTAQWDSGARQRTYLAIQNVGAPLAAGAAKVYYFDKNGVSKGVHSLAALATGAKLNSTPIDASASNLEFGYYDDGTFGGSVVVACPSVTCNLAVIARVQTKTTGEDYTGQPIASFTAP
jgi:hypothetical protein